MAETKTKVVFPTPEWLGAVFKEFHKDPEDVKKFVKLADRSVAFRIIHDTRIGLEEDITYIGQFKDGDLVKCAFINEEAAKKATWLVTANYETWRNIIQAKEKFIADLMTGKVVLDEGDASTLLPLGPQSILLAAIFNRVDTEYPDSYSPEKLQEFTKTIREFRGKLKV